MEIKPAIIPLIQSISSIKSMKFEIEDIQFKLNWIEEERLKAEWDGWIGDRKRKTKNKLWLNEWIDLLARQKFGIISASFHKAKKEKKRWRQSIHS